MKNELLQLFLIDVRDRGSACIEKKKILWMLGRKNDGAGAWSSLLAEWEELGGDKSALHGIEWGPQGASFITVTAMQPANIEESWAG